MATSEPPDRTASNREDGLDGSRNEALSAYVAWLEGRPLAARSRHAYRRTANRLQHLLQQLNEPLDPPPSPCAH